jgi:hypothetical protein
LSLVFEGHRSPEWCVLQKIMGLPDARCTAAKAMAKVRLKLNEVQAGERG